MAKRSAFEERINAEFRWPQRGDRPFVAAPDGRDNAVIATDRVRMSLMTEGYKQAADLMVEKSEAEPHIRDFLVYPIIFNYRQFLELSLKWQIATYGHEVGVKPNWKTHDLNTLWNLFVQMLEAFGTEDPDQADPIIGEIVAEFAKIDPRSYSYRYPVDTQGKSIPIAYTDLHLPSLRDVMTAVGNYFTGCDGYLDNLVGAGPGKEHH